MLCVIPHIHKYASDNSYGDNRKHVNNATKTLFYGLYEDEFHARLDLFWIEYTDFNHNNGYFDGDEFIWKI